LKNKPNRGKHPDIGLTAAGWTRAAPEKCAMIDIASVIEDLNKARRARIDAELACCDIEELAETIRCSHLAFRRLIAEQREFALH
jgi:hypothetical protein